MEPLAATSAALPISTQGALVRRAARGDALAFERLVSIPADRAFRIARAILGNDSDASDATQDAFVSAWRELPRLSDPESFDAWLRWIIVNACRAQLRGGSASARSVSTRGWTTGLPVRRSRTASVTPTCWPMRSSALDADKRSILVLHYLNHEPVAAIANAFRIPVGTAKWRLSEARAALQRRLDGRR